MVPKQDSKEQFFIEEEITAMKENDLQIDNLDDQILHSLISLLMKVNLLN